jgi:hypothetical protein
MQCCRDLTRSNIGWTSGGKADKKPDRPDRQLSASACSADMKMSAPAKRARNANMCPVRYLISKLTLAESTKAKKSFAPQNSRKRPAA